MRCIMRQSGIVWDNHACLPLRDVDEWLPSLSRYRDAGVDVVTVNIGDSLVPLETLIRTAASIRHFVHAHPGPIPDGTHAADLRAAKASGRLAVCLDVEGVHALGGQVIARRVPLSDRRALDAPGLQPAQPRGQRMPRSGGRRPDRAWPRDPCARWTVSA